MPALKADIITQLKKEILALQGFRPLLHQNIQVNLGIINHSFPNSQFPLGVNHEFICNNNESVTASSGFIAGILSSLLQLAYAKASADRPACDNAPADKGPAFVKATAGKAATWISSSHHIFPPALSAFGIDPSQLIFIHLRNQKEILWTIEEALKCEGLTAVVGEIANIDLTASRRLQLATEQSGVTGFLLRTNQRAPGTTACSCRWQIHSLQSEAEHGLPGIGFPRWQVELLKVRNGKPGSWQLEWVNTCPTGSSGRGQFKEVVPSAAFPVAHKEAV